MNNIGFHTDAFNSSYWNFEQCLQWAQRNHVTLIECGAIDGVSWIHGLGYQPHVALWEDPVLLRRKMDKYGVAFSNLDAAFPLSLPEGATLGFEYICHTIRWAKLAGCPRVDTTDDRYMSPVMTESEALKNIIMLYRRLVPIAEAYEIVLNVEPHGYFTTKPDYMAEILDSVDSPYLRMNMDTGNTFIAGQDPVAFTKRFLKSINHVHLKDVNPALAVEAGGDLTGIPLSHCAIGDGVNAENIRQCIELLLRSGFNGPFSLECEGAGGPMIERSLGWVRETMKNVQAQLTSA